MLMCHKLKKLTLDTLVNFVACHRMLPAVSCTKYTYAHTPKGSSLQRLLVDLFVYQSDERDFDGSATHPVELVNAVAQKFVSPRGHKIDASEASYNTDMCNTYHEHSDGEEKCN